MPREGIVLGLEPVDGLSDILLLHTGDHFGKYPLYIVPRGGPNPDLILGGTITPVRGQVRHYESVALNEIPHARTKDHAIRIIESCQLIEPKLRGKTVNRVSVGYRPARVKGSRTEPVRLEPEFSGPLAGKLVHNYGHGGGGVTFSWGCAERAATWVEQLNSSREVTGSFLARVPSDRKPELA
jgi:D-amino-acid oxidase